MITARIVKMTMLAKYSPRVILEVKKVKSAAVPIEVKTIEANDKWLRARTAAAGHRKRQPPRRLLLPLSSSHNALQMLVLRFKLAKIWS